MRTPWIRPTMRCAPHGLLVYRLKTIAGKVRTNCESASSRIQITFDCEERPSPAGTAGSCLILFLTCFLAAALASERFFYSLPLARLQVKRVTLYFLDNVLGLYFPLEPPKRVFEGLTFLKSNFRQRTTPPTRPNWTR